MRPSLLMLALIAILAAGCAAHSGSSSAVSPQSTSPSTSTGSLPPSVVPSTSPGSASPVASPTARSDSGIQGRTMVDGGCPLIRDASPCPDKPLPAKLTITRRGSDTVIASATSDANGNFRIPLPPGDYVLRPTNLAGGLHPAASPMDVTVQAGRYTTVTVPFDSGIR